MNIRIFWVRAMKCMCAQTRPQFILSSERVFLGNGVWTHVNSKGKIPYTGKFPQRRIEPATLWTASPNTTNELFRPLLHSLSLPGMQLIRILVTWLSFSKRGWSNGFFCVLRYISRVHHFGWDFCICDPFFFFFFFYPTVEVVTFHLRGWCVLSVFMLPAFTHLGHESQDLWVHLVECMCAQTRPRFLHSSKSVFKEWSQNPC